MDAELTVTVRTLGHIDIHIDTDIRTHRHTHTNAIWCNSNTLLSIPVLYSVSCFKTENKKAGETDTLPTLN